MPFLTARNIILAKILIELPLIKSLVDWNREHMTFYSSMLFVLYIRLLYQLRTAIVNLKEKLFLFSFYTSTISGWCKYLCLLRVNEVKLYFSCTGKRGWRKTTTSHILPSLLSPSFNETVWPMLSACNENILTTIVYA